MFGDAPWYVLLLAYLVPIAYVGVPVALLYLASRFLRAYERRGQSGRAMQQLDERLALLETQVARLGTDHERLREGHAFTQALLAERGAVAVPRARAEDSAPAI